MLKKNMTMLLMILFLFSCNIQGKLGITDISSVGVSDISFNKDVWHKYSSRNGAITSFSASFRLRMYSDLQDNILPGMTRKEIVNLLGESEIKTNQKSESLSYFVGVIPFRIDASYVDINFDKNGNYISSTKIK